MVCLEYFLIDSIFYYEFTLGYLKHVIRDAINRWRIKRVLHRMNTDSNSSNGSIADKF